MSSLKKLFLLSGVLVCCGILVFMAYIGRNRPAFIKPLEGILEQGHITLITQNNAHCYYLYKGEPIGFEYELAKMFADYLGVALHVTIAETWEDMTPLLTSDPKSFIASSMVITPERQNQALFTQDYLAVRQHIIVHREHQAIKTPQDLQGKTVHIKKGKHHLATLNRLKTQGIALDIKLHEDLTDEALFRMVAEKEIEATIADSTIAKLNRRYYPDVRISDPISDSLYLGWAVHPNALKLLERMNSFFSSVKKDGTLQAVFDKYYGDIDEYDDYSIRAFHDRIESRLPKYRPLIQAAAQEHDLDWRLIAAQMYQESHFNPKAQSHANAHGLMQLTRATANMYKVKDIYNPEQNIQAGVRHLKILYDSFSAAAEEERMSIALAAYNVGQGHVVDAQGLAISLGKDPNKWSSIAETLLLLSHPTWHRNALHGYCRGQEPVDYVKQIKLFYDILKRAEG